MMSTAEGGGRGGGNDKLEEVKERVDEGEKLQQDSAPKPKFYHDVALAATCRHHRTVSNRVAPLVSSPSGFIYIIMHSMRATTYGYVSHKNLTTAVI